MVFLYLSLMYLLAVLDALIKCKQLYVVMLLCGNRMSGCSITQLVVVVYTICMTGFYLCNQVSFQQGY